MRAYSETKLFQIHRWVFLLAMPLKIVLPEIWFIISPTTLDRTNPIGPTIFMCGFDVTFQAVVASEARVANITTVARSAVAPRPSCCFDGGRA
jgi:hypothetical protein